MNGHGQATPSQSISSRLLENARAGDEIACERLVRLFHPFVYRWLRRWGIPESEAPDVIQNVFAKVFPGLARFDRGSPGSTFRGWIWRIARNEAADYHRTRRPRQATEHELDTLPEVQKPGRAMRRIARDDAKAPRLDSRRFSTTDFSNF